jgi:hypothetical protein
LGVDRRGGLSSATKSRADSHASAKACLDERDRMFPPRRVDADDDDREGMPLRAAVVARANASSGIGRPAHDVARVDKEMHDRVATRTEVRACAAPERRPDPGRKLQMHLRRDRDVSAERALEGSSPRDYAVHAYLGLYALRLRMGHRCGADEQRRDSHRAFTVCHALARWRRRNSV